MDESKLTPQFLYKCNACGYSAQIIEDSHEDFISHLETKICLDCKMLVAVPVKFKATAYIGGDPGFPTSRIENECPKCWNTNVKEWDEMHPCPNCSKHMTRIEID